MGNGALVPFSAHEFAVVVELELRFGPLEPVGVELDRSGVQRFAPVHPRPRKPALP